MIVPFVFVIMRIIILLRMYYYYYYQLIPHLLLSSFTAQALQETSVYNFSFCILDEMYILIKYPKYGIF